MYITIVAEKQYFVTHFTVGFSNNLYILNKSFHTVNVVWLLYKEHFRLKIINTGIPTG